MMPDDTDGNFVAGSDVAANDHPGNFDDADDLAGNFDANYGAVTAFDGLNNADINYAGDNKAALYDASLDDATNYVAKISFMTQQSTDQPIFNSVALSDTAIIDLRCFTCRPMQQSTMLHSTMLCAMMPHTELNNATP